MKRLLFRLERLLHLRTQEESLRARDLGRALQQEEERRRASEEAASHVDRCRTQVADPAGAVSPAGALRNLEHAVDLAQRRAQVAEAALHASEKKVAQVREEYGEARKERRVLERLRERHDDAVTEALTREEQKETDQVAQERWRRRGAV